MNFFNIYLEGLGLMNIRLQTGMAVNEGLLHPVLVTSIEIVPGMPLEDSILIFDPH